MRPTLAREDILSDQRSALAREIAMRPEVRAYHSEAIRRAWQAGKFASRRPRKVTPERAALCLRMYAAGDTTGDIACRTGLRPQAIRRFLQRSGVWRARRTEAA